MKKMIDHYHHHHDDNHQVRCDQDRPILDVALQDTECRPYILPLFPKTAEVMMGRNLTWLCKMVNIILIFIVIFLTIIVIIIIFNVFLSSSLS